MSGILAVFDRTGQMVNPEVMRSMLAACPHRAIHGHNMVTVGPVALGHQHFWVTPEEHGERQPLVAKDGLAITFDGRLDNRQYLLHLLQPRCAEPVRLSDATLVAHAYRRWGEMCPEHLLGDFSFALWDAQKHHLFLVRDALGGRELHYFTNEKWLVAASEIQQVLAHPAVCRMLNEGKVAEYLAGVWLDTQETFYTGVQACPPGHTLTVTTGNIGRHQYWMLDPEKRLHLRDDREYATRFRSLLTEAVGCRLRTTGPLAVSLSGGLDSTSIAVVAASMLAGSPAQQRRLISISYVFDELHSCDERTYIESVVLRADLDPTYLVCDRCWTLRDVDRWPTSPNSVTGDAFAWLPLKVLQAAQNTGCRVLLNGHFGDALFAGGRFWAADMLRELQFRSTVVGGLRNRGLSRYRHDLRSNGLALMAPAGMLDIYNQLRPPTKAPMSIISRSFAAHSALEDRLRQHNRLRRDVPLDRSLRWRSLADTPWPQAIALAREFGHQNQVEIAMPWWDRRLVEFAMAVPAYQLGQFGQTRWVQRNAMDGLLPNSVRSRSTKTTFQTLFEKGLLEQERATVARLLSNPQIVQRGYVEAEQLTQEKGASEARRKTLYPLWLVLSLELWLRRYWP